jgi:hypothetical protein
MPFPDPFTSLAPAAVATGPEGARRIDLFLTLPELGRMGYENLWHRSWLQGRGWRPRHSWYQRGGIWTSAVSACAYSGGRVDLFGIGLDGGLYQSTGLGSALDRSGPWAPVPHGHPGDWTIISSPATMMPGPTEIIAGVRTQRRRADGRIQRKLFYRMLVPDPENPFAGEWRWRPRIVGTWPSLPTTLATATALDWRAPGVYDSFSVSSALELVQTSYENGSITPLHGFEHDSGITSTPSIAVWQNPNGSRLSVAACYGPFPPLLGGAVVVKQWDGRRWHRSRQVYNDGITDGRGIAGPPVIASWGEPRLDLFFVSQANLVGADPGVTHGVSEDGTHWDFSEVLPLPSFT